MTDAPSVSPDDGIDPSTSGENGKETHLTNLAESVRYSELVDKMQLAAVKGARETGATWQQIGDALGTTHQAARQRWISKLERSESHRTPPSVW